MRVSVVIPTLNEATRVVAAINSAMTSGADEVIVVDGGSTDETVEFARPLASVFQCEAGRATQQNTGAHHATGDVLLFLHADCRLTDNAITAVRNQMTACEKLQAGCFRQKIDQPGFRYRLVAASNGIRVRLLKLVYGDQGIFIRTDVFHELGGFPAVSFLEDLLLSRQLKKKGTVRLLNEPLIVSARRWQRRGLIRQTIRNWAIVIAALMGISPNRLVRFYPNIR